MNLEAPIIFIHYGNSDYLKFTIKAAKHFNSEKRIILLGDESNQIVAKNAKIEHFLFADYGNSDEIIKFENVYKHVAGANHGKNYWTNFVFKRWFYMHAFLKAHSIQKFWTFDSDTIILTKLYNQEHKFLAYDCTEQCDGICMNGFVTNFKVVQGYVEKINQLFERSDYLNSQIEEFKSNPDFAFTEMRAYLAYKEEEKISSIHLTQILNGETFDDCICVSHGMERYDQKLNGNLIKKLYLSKNGGIYCYHVPTNEYVKMNTMNMSWVPTYLYKYILTHAIDKKWPPTYLADGTSEYKVLNVFHEPASLKMKKLLVRGKSKILEFFKK